MLSKHPTVACGAKALRQGLQGWGFWQTRSHLSTWDTADSGILADTALGAQHTQDASHLISFYPLLSIA